uniref:Uncharacterized protein n=1 Tax=Varanus komodoensis TaxID=61221 RepID=A0A8D2L9H3_VARKO
MYLALLDAQCTQNSYAAEVEELRRTRVAGSRMERQWLFQTCTEFGYYLTCEDPACPFSRLPNLTASLWTCLRVFNVSPRSVQEAVAFTNDYYGAEHPRASRVLFVNGDVDPWHVLSVLQNQTRSERAILISGTAHCADMLASMPSDPLPLVRAREVRRGGEAAQKAAGGRGLQGKGLGWGPDPPHFWGGGCSISACRSPVPF